MRLIFSVSVIILLTACGGARSPDLGINSNAILVSSNSSISWTAPSSYQDDSPLPLSDISGYLVYVGDSNNTMLLNTNIADSNITSFKLDKLSKGIHFIAVSCYDVYGMESSYSSILVVNII